MEPKVAPRFAVLEAAVKATPKDAKPFTGKHSIVDHKGDGDTVLVYAAGVTALAAGKAPPYIRGRHLDGDDVAQCWVAVRQKQYASFPLQGHALGEAVLEPLSAHVLPLACESILKATYAAVVSVVEAKGTRAESTESYTRGKNVGVVDLYNLADGTLVGRKTIEAASAASLTYKTDSAGPEPRWIWRPQPTRTCSGRRRSRSRRRCSASSSAPSHTALDGNPVSVYLR